MAAVQIARQAGALISFDVNYRPDLWSRSAAYERVMETIPHVDLLKINEIESAILGCAEQPPTHQALNALARELLARGPALCVVTLGPEGSYCQVAEGGEHVPPFGVKTVDATGCGDGFIAALIWRLISGGNWRDQLSMARMRPIMRYANAVGALTSMTQGVIPALPTAAQVERFLREKGYG
jgi:fructokinase